MLLLASDGPEFGTGEFWFTLAYTVIGGLCVFLLGLKILSEGLQAVASDFIRKVIGWLTNNRFLAVLVGLFVTMIVQSSSVTTVMVVGFVNAGLMTLKQAIGVIFGANIGTTITGWIIAVKVGKYGLVFLGLGLVPYFFMKGKIPKNIGKTLCALGLIFLGLVFMSSGFKPLANSPEFKEWLTIFDASNHLSVLACIAVGCLLTFIVQSSSAMLGITIVLATTTGNDGTAIISFYTAAALVFGENIGTTVTALLASIGGTVNAKRAAYAHMIFNVLGVTVMFAFFFPYVEMVESLVRPMADDLANFLHIKKVGDTSDASTTGILIAASHSIFNITNVIVFLPMLGLLARIVTWLRPDKAEKEQTTLKLLGDLSNISPELAIQEAEREIEVMASNTQRLLTHAVAVISNPAESSDTMAEIDRLEDITDRMHMEMTVFLTKVVQRPISEDQANEAFSLVRISDELESIGDFSQAAARHINRIRAEERGLPEACQADASELASLSLAVFEKTADLLLNGKTKIQDVFAASAEVKTFADSIKERHAQRLADGSMDGITGMAFSDIVVALRRIKNHCVNIVEAHQIHWKDWGNPKAIKSRLSGDTDRNVRSQPVDR